MRSPFRHWALNPFFRSIPILGFFMILLVNISRVFSHELYEIYGPTSPPLDIVDAVNQNRLGKTKLFQDNQINVIPGFLSYEMSLDSNRHAYIEVSGELDEDDPLENFTSYLLDPVNWDLTGQIERRFAHGVNVGLTHSGRILGGPSTFRMGLQSRLENAQIQYVSSRGRAHLTSIHPVDLIDVTYAPYIAFESTPVSWMRLIGDVRADVLYFDVQNVCRTTCSVEPNGPVNDIIPSVKGNLILEPWSGTEFFMNVGTGFYSYGEREPTGSTAAVQISRSTAYEIGIRTRLADRIDLMSSLWSMDLDSNLAFLGDGELFKEEHATRRYGTTFSTRMNLMDWVTVSGGLTFLQTEIRQTGASVPLSPNLTSYATLEGRWSNGWTSRLHMRHIGRRAAGRGEDRLLRSLTIFDLMTHYHLPIPSSESRLELSFGLLNLTNATGPHSQISFNSRLGVDQATSIDLQYFPGQPRTVVSGLSWHF